MPRIWLAWPRLSHGEPALAGVEAMGEIMLKTI
jgi:hypothetical protein